MTLETKESVNKIMTLWSEDHPLDQSMDHLHEPLRKLTIKNENEAYCDCISSKRELDKFWHQFSLISPRGGNFKQICGWLSPSVCSVGSWVDWPFFQHQCRQFCITCEGGGGKVTCPDFGLMCALVEPKSGPITQAKFFIEKTPKTFKMTRFY